MCTGLRGGRWGVGGGSVCQQILYSIRRVPDVCYWVLNYRGAVQFVWAGTRKRTYRCVTCFNLVNALKTFYVILAKVSASHWQKARHEMQASLQGC